MKVNVIGPNLPDQSKGSFHVHEAGCRDGIRLDKATGAGDEFDASSRSAVVEWVYADHLAEGSDWDACREDFHFCPCTADLVEGEVPVDYREIAVTLYLRKADLEALAESELFDSAFSYGAQQEIVRALATLTGWTTG